MRHRGFRAIVILSGHWSIQHNIAAIEATGEEFRRAHPATGWLLLTDQEMVPELHTTRWSTRPAERPRC